MLPTKNSYLNRTLEFHQIYAKEILPRLRAYEVHRKRENKKYSLSMWLGCLLAFLPWFFIFTTTKPWLVFISVMGSIIGFCIIFSAASMPQKFVSDIKVKCLPKVLRVFGNIEWSTAVDGIPDIDLIASALFPYFNNRRTDDMFEGSYKDVDFCVSETLLQNIVQTTKCKRTETVFQGVVIKFKANKTIKNRTIVVAKGDNCAKIAGWSIFVASIIPFIRVVLEDPSNRLTYILGTIFMVLLTIIGYFAEKQEEPLDEVKLEDPRFCKKYNAYSSDQTEARYLLTTAFIERFQNLKTAFGAKKAKCSFYGNSLMVAISTNKNLFEIGSFFESFEDPTSINAFYDELSSIYKMIDYFKLDEKTGL